MGSLQNKESHGTTVLNPELNTDFGIIVKIPVLIQTMCQTVDPDTRAAERLAHE